MVVLRRVGLMIPVFLAVLLLLAFTGWQRPLDYAVYLGLAQAGRGAPTLGERIRLVDLPYPASLKQRGDPSLFRARTAELLERLAADPAARPDAVVLDMWISKDDRGLAPLVAAVERATKAGVRVFASFNPDAENEQSFDDLMNEHARPLYQGVLSGWGHTWLQAPRGVLSYERELALKSAGGTRIVRALPTVLARELGWPQAPGNGPLAIPLGPATAVAERTVAFVHDGEATSGGRFLAPGGAPAKPDWRDTVVVVGSLAEDVNKQTTQAGPQLLVWALEDARQANRGARVPLDQPLLVAALVITMGLVTALAVALLFQLVNPLRSRPAALALAGALLGAVVFVALSAAALALGVVLPAGLPLAAVATSAVLAWTYARKFLASGQAEGSGEWDVFISYSRQHGDWVARHVYEPLAAARKADGTPLRVFFDRQAIGIGEAFTSKYMWAIVDSRVFIPVFSPDYYRKNHCRNEMDLAYKRHVDQRLVIAPLALAPDAVPEIFTVLNYIDVTAQPGFIDGILRTVITSTGRPAR